MKLKKPKKPTDAEIQQIVLAKYNKFVQEIKDEFGYHMKPQININLSPQKIAK